jgi:tetratricopeptide (TPR) repeat protein
MLKSFYPSVLIAAVCAAGAVALYATWTPREETPERTVAIERPSLAADPLKIVLTPLGGDEKIDRQIADLQQRIAAAPEQHLLLERLGWAFVAKARLSSDPGYYTLAEQAAKALQTAAPDEPAALLLLGHTHHAMHRFAEAEKIALQLTGEREFAFDYALLGDALMEQGRLDPAIAAYQKMIDLKPCLQTYSRVAYMRWLKGDLRGAIGAARAAVSAGSPKEPEATAWASTRLAAYEWQAGEMAGASSHLDLALQRVPGYAPALLLRGKLLMADGKFADAIPPLEQAAAASPLPDYLWSLSDALRAAGRNDEAGKVETELARSGASADPRTYSIFLSTRGERAAQALLLAKEELQTRQDVFTYDALAWAQFSNGEVIAAQENMQRALAEGTHDARLFFHAATIAAAAGENARALEFLTEARALERVLLPSERAALGQTTAALLAATDSQISSNQSTQKPEAELPIP